FKRQSRTRPPQGRHHHNKGPRHRGARRDHRSRYAGGNNNYRSNENRDNRDRDFRSRDNRQNRDYQESNETRNVKPSRESHQASVNHTQPQVVAQPYVPVQTSQPVNIQPQATNVTPFDVNQPVSQNVQPQQNTAANNPPTENSNVDRNQQRKPRRRYH